MPSVEFRPPGVRHHYPPLVSLNLRSRIHRNHHRHVPRHSIITGRSTEGVPRGELEETPCFLAKFRAHTEGSPSNSREIMGGQVSGGQRPVESQKQNSSSAVDTTLNRKFYYSHFHYLCRRWAGGPCWSNAYGVGLSNRFRDRRTRRRALATYRDPHRVGKRDRHRLVLEAVAFVFRVGSNSE